jgi:hypothetical protein
MRDPYDSLDRAIAMAEGPEERAEVGTALAQYYADLAPSRGCCTAPPVTTEIDSMEPSAYCGAFCYGRGGEARRQAPSPKPTSS